VIANQSYEDFARQLQKEIEDEAGVNFGTERIQKKRDRRKLKLKRGWKADKEFLELWSRVQPKTRYQVQLDSGELISKVVRRIEKLPTIKKPKLRAEKVSVEMDEEQGLETRLKRSRSREAETVRTTTPNLLEYLSQGTDLTKRTLLEILCRSDRLEDALASPQQFLDLCVEKTNKMLNQMLVDGIKYEKVGEEYAMSLFESEEIESYLDNMYQVKNQQKTLFDYIIWDAKSEEKFAKDLESMERVKFYIKLPGWFRIDTPLGTYNPDWAVVFNGDKRVYFVAESKASPDEEDLRLKEKLKIKCGKKHFEQLDGVEFDVAKNPSELVDN
jgi:type III restriction enzyme